MKNLERELKNVAFPNYEKFSDVSSTYSDPVNEITQVINNLAPYETVQSEKSFQRMLLMVSLLNKSLIGTDYLKSSEKVNFTLTN